MYAIVKTGGKQYTVRPGDVLDVEKLPGQPGDTVALQVLFLNDGTKVLTSAEELAGVNVTAQIVEQHKGDKQLVFKFKKRKGYKRTRGHRQQLTKLAIVDVAGVTAEAPVAPAAAEPEPEPEEAPAAAEPEAVEEPVAAEPEAEAPAEEPETEEPAEEAEPEAEPEPEVEEEPAAEEAAEAPAEEPEPVAEEEPAEEAQDLSKLTVAQLKELAKEKGIKLASGARKAEIIETIENAL